VRPLRLLLPIRASIPNCLSSSGRKYTKGNSKARAYSKFRKNWWNIDGEATNRSEKRCSPQFPVKVSPSMTPLKPFGSIDSLLFIKIVWKSMKTHQYFDSFGFSMFLNEFDMFSFVERSLSVHIIIIKWRTR
jgi:hypothetical protein